jgi:predicted lipoprotein with Yx(FWY)xxD motif
MQPRVIFTGSLAAIALLAAACGATSQTTAGATPAPSAVPSASPIPSPIAASPSPVVVAGTKVTVANNSRLGRILVDGRGRTLYLFLADMGKTSTCYAVCAQYWPPVLTKGTPLAVSGASASLLGTTKRKDGRLEVTYAGHPLYYFISDMKAGDTTGQGVNGFGALWYVVSPSGMLIR